MITNALSVDVEEHFQVEAFASQVTPDDWPRYESRVEQNTARLLDLFARRKVRGTFFVVGWVAERHPLLVRRIASEGHEVACHSHWHRHITRLTPQEFREDSRRAKRVLEDIIGAPVDGYRAPTFSIMPSSLWALEILREEGFTYDSSVFPIRHDLYGIPSAPRFLFRWRFPSGGHIVEFPASTVALGTTKLPIAGGGWMRILPMSYTRWGLNRLTSVDREPAMIYLHPWEVDPGQPRIAAPWKSRMRHYSNLRHMESRLDHLLSRIPFGPVRDVIRERMNAGPIEERSLTSFVPATQHEAQAQAR